MCVEMISIILLTYPIDETTRTCLVSFSCCVHKMPAVNEIDADDFHKIMNNRLFDFWLVSQLAFDFDVIHRVTFEYVHHH
jgi:hypothetical protein